MKLTDKEIDEFSFTSTVSFIFGFVCIKEAAGQTEVTYRPVYFLRLSSAATESVIFVVVMLKKMCSRLQEIGVLERKGSKRDGRWIVK